MCISLYWRDACVYHGIGVMHYVVLESCIMLYWRDNVVLEG